MSCTFDSIPFKVCPDAEIPGSVLCARHWRIVFPGEPFPDPAIDPTLDPNATLDLLRSLAQEAGLPDPTIDLVDTSVSVRATAPSPPLPSQRERGSGGEGGMPPRHSLADLLQARDPNLLLAALTPGEPSLSRRAPLVGAGSSQPSPHNEPVQIRAEPVNSLAQPVKKESAPSAQIDNRQSAIDNGRSRPAPPHLKRPERLAYYQDTEQWDLLSQEIREGDKRRAGLMPPKAYRGPRCKGVTFKGDSCKAHVQRDNDYCFFHDPAQAHARRHVSRDAARASAEARSAPRPLLEPRVATLADPLSVQVLLDAVLRLELLGKMTDARGKRLARLLSLAVKNVGRDGLDPAAYAARRNSLDAELSDVVRQYEQQDHERHIESVATVGMKRQEFLKANELFAAS